MTTDRYSHVKPASSRWRDGWLLSMTTINGWVMAQYPGDRPFVLSSDEWNALPEYRRVADPAVPKPTRYAVNRLRVGAKMTDMVLMSKVADADEGRSVGLLIENRGSATSRWVFIGQIEAEHRGLDTVCGMHGVEVDRLIHHGVNLREMLGSFKSDY